MTFECLIYKRSVGRARTKIQKRSKNQDPISKKGRETTKIEKQERSRDFRFLLDLEFEIYLVLGSWILVLNYGVPPPS